jgi:hypothetical protein
MGRLTAPLEIPAAPTPAKARPTMKATELGAAPDTAEPASNRKTALKKVYLMLKKE